MFESPSLSLALTASVPVEIDGRDVWSQFKLDEGESAVFALDRIGDGVGAASLPDRRGGGAVRRHGRFWRSWLSALALPRPLAGDGAPLRAHAEAAHLRADRRRSWPRRRPACPSRSAASATGTTATYGSATPRSASTRCSGWASPRRPRRSWASCPSTSAATAAARRARCRSCTASTAAANCPSASCATWRATGARPPYGSATPPSTSSSWTSTGPSSTPSTSTTSGASRSPATAGSRSARWSTGSATTGTSPTKASGRPAAGARTSSTRG